MVKKIFIAVFGILTGVGAGYIWLAVSESNPNILSPISLVKTIVHKKQVIGFLPFWLLDKSRADYNNYITTLSYFSLIVDGEGKIRTMDNPTESEPGWHALNSGRAGHRLKTALKNGQKLSLVIFAADEDDIGELMQDPENHAKTLLSDISPIMQTYHFTDLNLDIESVTFATDGARANFTKFVRELHYGIRKNKLGTLSIDIAPDSLIHERLISLPQISEYVDHVILMTYDYHYSGSVVTGPVAPLYGAGTTSEFDVDTAVSLALQHIPSKKLLLGVPLYGYQWESIQDASRSATIPGSGITVSSKYMEDFLHTCSSCSAQYDSEAHENYVTYPDDITGTFYQAYFPGAESMREKIEFTKQRKLGGMAMWALGYEDSKILEPLRE